MMRAGPSYREGPKSVLPRFHARLPHPPRCGNPPYCTTPSAGRWCSGPAARPLKPLVATTYINCQQTAPDSKNAKAVQ